jgi:pyroglutamyl-peptidase
MSSCRRDRPVILLTGFGPFPGAPLNASAVLIQELLKMAPRRLPGFAVHAEVLPTEWQEAPRRLALLLDRLEPTIALHFGVSHRARGFVVETRALNARRDIVDACGEAPDGVCVVSDGPGELRATLPTGLIVEMLRRKGLPVQLSRDAGGYLCNAVLYHSLEAARRLSSGSGGREGAGLRVGARRGFIHIPDRLAGEQSIKARRAQKSLLDWDQAVEGGISIMELVAGVAGTGES